MPARGSWWRCPPAERSRRMALDTRPSLHVCIARRYIFPCWRWPMSMRIATADEPTEGDLALGETLREITRGGLAGLIVGVLLAGVGGRLVMRLAALMVP